MQLANRVLVSLLAGLVIGIAITASRQPMLLALVTVIEPVGILWVNAIRMTVIPLIVSLLVVGITSESNAGAVGRLGGRALGVFVD